MTKKSQKIFAVVLIVALVFSTLVGFGFWYYYGVYKKSIASESKTTEEVAEDSQGKVSNVPEDTTTVQTKPSTSTTPVSTDLDTLGEVSLTVYLITTESVAQDGATTIPVGSLTPYFYMPAGTYTIQKLTSGAWKDVITNQSYPGHGGIAAWFMGPTEESVQYRVLGIESGKAVSVSKTFTVKRADLVNGTRTYN